MAEHACRLRPQWLHLALLLGLVGGLAAGLWLSGSAAHAQSGLPTKPAVHTIAALHQGLRVYWYEPSEDGGSPLTRYDVHYRASDAQTWTDAGHTSLSQPAVITGLRFATTYEVRVRARNANGAGPWSATESRRTSPNDGKPDQPWPPTLEAGDGQIQVSWTAPAYTGGLPITGYRVRYTTDNAVTWNSWVPGGNRLIRGTSTTITGLDNGVAVGVVVAAVNARGQGRYSSPIAEAAAIEPKEGVARIPLPASVQKSMIFAELSSAMYLSSLLRGLLVPPGISGQAEESINNRNALLAELIRRYDEKVKGLSALYSATIPDRELRLPVTKLFRESNGQQVGDGIAFTKYTYAAELSPGQTVPVVRTEKDPTQIVLWGQATRVNVDRAFKHHTRLDHTPTGANLYRWQRDECRIEDLRNLSRAILGIIEKTLALRIPGVTRLQLSERAIEALDDAVGNSQFMAMKNTASDDSGRWVWSQSTGLQPVRDSCITDTRDHIRFFASDDTQIEGGSPLAMDQGDFGYWSVVAAHREDPKGIVDHRVRSWDDAEQWVVASLSTPDPNTDLDWVRNIERKDFDNRVGSSGVAPQGVPHDGMGYMIEMGPLPTSEPVALDKPDAPRIGTDGNRHFVRKPKNAD